MKTCFLILHYNEIDLTAKAVDSIVRMDNGQHDRAIVIVDNKSPNNSGEVLVSMYAEGCDGEMISPNVKAYRSTKLGCELVLLLNSENGGFSKGNNIGYSYIRDNMDADFVVALNNDITFPQHDFLEKLVKVYEDNQFYLAGPDVYTPYIRSHISPLYQTVRGKEEIEEKIRLLDRHIDFYEKDPKPFMYMRYLQDKYQDSFVVVLYNKIRQKEYSGATPYDAPAYGCVLNGACLIFDKKYIEEYDVLFEEETFLYGEEDFLTKRLTDDGHTIRYCPELVTLHVGNGSAGFKNMNYKQYRQKNAEMFRRIRSAYEKYMQKYVD